MKKKPLLGNPKKTPAKRGRPKKTEPRITQEDIELIAEHAVRGRRSSEIARTLGVDRKTVEKYLDSHVRPVWRDRISRGVEEEIAKLDHLERIAWERLAASQAPQSRRQIKQELQKEGGDLKTTEIVLSKIECVGEPAWAAIIRACVETRAKMLGIDKPTDKGLGSGDAQPVVVEVMVETRDQARRFQNFDEWERN